MGLPSSNEALASSIRSLTPMDATEALNRIRTLVQTEPNFRSIGDDSEILPETLKWIGQLGAVLHGMKLNVEEGMLAATTNTLVRSQGRDGSGEIRAILYRALGKAEFDAPASEQGAFIAAGEEMDAYAAISRVIQSAEGRLLIVDPYMDGKALTDYLPSANEHVELRVLTDKATMKPTLNPAAERWVSQYGTTRPLELRAASSKSLHDRLIVVDEATVWSLTQSLKDFARRSHGAILKVDSETAAMKIGAYLHTWDHSELL